ncbi:hypothetical protein [Aureliella helgolandensis]|uniref:Uncharacterized protein n=1 Tax=Aureliella helgolandensis TaxID=2527968 RepID=A0A518GC09_9BACT|nr:hypothetical protein [Aureliella helgolandensis]QDV26060.1 hypothetical protein Q31a_44310 [Aureliella helgolandensis]
MASQPASTTPSTSVRNRRTSYRCVATSPAGLVQQVAVSYLRHGYWYYVTGQIPESKDPETVDRKLLTKYDIDITERQRAYRKQQGLANMQYIRFERWFILLITDGHHPFKQEEKQQIRDCRRHPIKFNGYSISYRRSGLTPAGGREPKWHSCVRIDNKTYRELKAYFLHRATRRSTDNLAQEFANIPYTRFAPIRRQLLTVLRAVNKSRQSAGFDSIPAAALSLRRVILRPFET